MAKSYDKLSKRARQIVSKYPFLEYLAIGVEGPIRVRKAWKSGVRELVSRLVGNEVIDYQYYEDLQVDGKEFAVLITNLKVEGLPELSQTVVYEIKEEIGMNEYYLRLNVVPAYIGEGEKRTPWNAWCDGYQVVGKSEYSSQNLIDLSDVGGVGFHPSNSDEAVENAPEDAFSDVMAAFVDDTHGDISKIYVKVTESVLDTINSLLKETEGKVYLTYTI